MFYLINIAIVALTLLIAYWWATQGLFSAILHLFCVVAAGAIAFSFWEIVTVRFLLHGNQFDDYAWGISLVLLFAISLFVLRLIADKIAPGNVDVPHWANLAFGLPVGLVAAELSIGILIIGAGHVQSQREIMGINGWQRGGNGRVQQIEDYPIWTMAHQVADEFFSRLSVGSLSTRTPLRHYNPDLYQQSTLLRDGVTDSRGRLVSKTSMLPSAASVRAMVKSGESLGAGDRARYQAVVRFERAAFDQGGQQLSLSAAQVRLIGEASATAKAPVAFPIAWSQRAGETIGYFKLDTPSHYMTSVPGAEEATIQMEFEALPGDARPRFIQIRNTRHTIPSINTVPSAEFQARRYTLGQAGMGDGACDPSRPSLTRDEIDITDRLPVVAGSNRLPSGISIDEKTKSVLEGKADFPRGIDRPARNLTVDSIFQQPGTRIVQLNVSRRTNADLFGALRRQVGDSVTPFLVDSQGRTYRALGYWHDKGQAVTIFMDRTDGVGSLRQLPELPSSGAESLWLIFEITEGVTLTCFRVNNIPVANVNLLVHESSRHVPATSGGTSLGGG
jgi:hypothetical protein